MLLCRIQVKLENPPAGERKPRMARIYYFAVAGLRFAAPAWLRGKRRRSRNGRGLRADR